MPQNTKILPFLIAILFYSSCLTTEVEGIKIGHNLYDTQGFSQNKDLVALIKQTLKKNDKSLVQLIDYWCGGAAGCYDLGNVITQIIFKMGEDDFILMSNRLTLHQKNNLKALIDVGFEYGDNSNYGIVNKTTLDMAFPKLYLILTTI
jgi:hypothetical protein